jgi:hypothetical protein
MRIRASYIVAAIFAVSLAVPVWARPKSVTVDVDEPTLISGARLSPGEYQIKFQDNANQVTVVQEGHVVAQVPCQWVELPNKAADSGTIFSDGRITEIDFGGQTKAIQFR